MHLSARFVARFDVVVLYQAVRHVQFFTIMAVVFDVDRRQEAVAVWISELGFTRIPAGCPSLRSEGHAPSLSGAHAPPLSAPSGQPSAVDLLVLPYMGQVGPGGQWACSVTPPLNS